MGAYGTPEHPPNQDNDTSQGSYGNYGQYQYPYQPIKKHHKKTWIIITVSIIGILVVMERYGAYLNSQGYGGVDSAAAKNNLVVSEPAPQSKPTPSSSAASTFISKATYDKLKTGMSYEAVVKLFGSPGKETAESGEKGSKDFMASYLWENKNGPQMIELSFTGNKLDNKTEYYLE